MRLSDDESAALAAIATSRGDRGEYVSIDRLLVAMEQPDAARLARTLRGLAGKQFVELDDAGAARMTEAGVAALKSM